MDEVLFRTAETILPVPSTSYSFWLYPRPGLRWTPARRSLLLLLLLLILPPPSRVPGGCPDAPVPGCLQCLGARVPRCPGARQGVFRAGFPCGDSALAVEGCESKGAVVRPNVLHEVVVGRTRTKELSHFGRSGRQ